MLAKKNKQKVKKKCLKSVLNLFAWEIFKKLDAAFV